MLTKRKRPAAATPGEAPLDTLPGQDRIVAPDAGQHDVAGGQQPIELVEGVGTAAEPVGQGLGVRLGSVHDAAFSESVVVERDERRLDHLARADQERALVLEDVERIFLWIIIQLTSRGRW